MIILVAAFQSWLVSVGKAAKSAIVNRAPRVRGKETDRAAFIHAGSPQAITEDCPRILESQRSLLL